MCIDVMVFCSLRKSIQVKNQKFTIEKDHGYVVIYSDRTSSWLHSSLINKVRRFRVIKILVFLWLVACTAM